MLSNKRGYELHGRLCREEPLTDGERAELEAWYAKQDADEMRSLHLDVESPSIAELRADLDRELRRLEKTVVEIHGIDARNKDLRQEISKLRRQLAKREPTLAR